jgi:pyridoxine 5-phosphate synthase
VALENGADQITIHLREDRRHIQDFDVFSVQKIVKEHESLLNFEIGATKEMVNLAAEISPDWVCLVPEKREEKTTEGGLNLRDDKVFENILQSSIQIKKGSPNTKISLFVESDFEILERIISIKKYIDAVEIHTGEYAIDFNHERPVSKHFESFRSGKLLMNNEGIGYHAGHGLTDQSTKLLVEQNLFAEYNIGHWIISQSVFLGLGSVITDLKNIIVNGSRRS